MLPVDLPQSTLEDLLQTLVLFLSSPTREILKSTLGFMKIATTTFPMDVLRPNLSTIIQALLPHAKDHGNHFKLRVTHIFERMGRRFGWDTVENSLNGGADEEGVKVLKNVRRRKERAKKKKRGEVEEEGEAPKAKRGEGFEEVLYGSESDSDGSEEEGEEEVQQRGKRKKDHGGAQLRMDDDEPMDLLEGVGGHLSGDNEPGFILRSYSNISLGAKGKRQRKPGQDASKFKTDDKSGKMIIASDDEGGNDNDTEPQHLGGGAYIESLTSTDGFTRGPNGKVKFHKDTKKRRLAEVEAMDVDEDAQAPSLPSKKKQKKVADVRLGKEFKAKVRSFSFSG
jgi:ribosomal RNA-processing protein 12